MGAKYKMVGLEKHIHSLQVRRGLKKSWLNALKRKNSQESRWPSLEAEISVFDRRIEQAIKAIRNGANDFDNRPPLNDKRRYNQWE
jgi:hypothetical protein